MTERILVTGGAGFIASHLCEALLAEGAEIVVIDDFNDFYDPAIKRGNIASFREKITLIEGDIRDQKLVDSLFEKHRFDKVFHCAARAGVRMSISDPRLYLSTNIDGTLNLLEGCRKTGVKHFVFASSSSVYGVNKKVPFAEDDLIQRTISPYAATKLAGEQLCSNYSHLHGIRCVACAFSLSTAHASARIWLFPSSLSRSWPASTSTNTATAAPPATILSLRTSSAA